MKIYASVRTELDDFIGTDLWVKVQGYQWSSEYYINIFRKVRNQFDQLCYEYRNVASMYIDHADNDFATYHNPGILKEIWVTPVNCIELFKPIEVVTTDEVYSILGVET